MRDGVVITGDKGDVYALWLDTIVSPLRRVIEPTIVECTGMLPDLCLKGLLHTPDGKARNGIMIGQLSAFIAPCLVCGRDYG